MRGKEIMSDPHQKEKERLPAPPEKAQPPEVKQEPPRPRVAIPPREPKGEADWRVIVRHSPLKFKSATLKATSKVDAWQKFLALAESNTTEAAYKRDGAAVRAEALNWLAAAKRDMPEGTEILGAEYARKRMDALRIKGTVTIDQIGFSELASA
jgi:hypothetical protein